MCIYTQWQVQIAVSLAYYYVRENHQNICGNKHNASVNACVAYDGNIHPSPAHTKSMCQKMETDFIPNREIKKKCTII